ncbi:VQ motif [Arabidopsis thaliana x Arabidopsis arenosa]|uniref:VQ motif n=1 Tax=Arabidopsis thaliana x Arabidopsis arenosa TaxID=1240361 RepID=A0A8T2C3Y8_9BRAS|nr:VQ motif [Arabidopsis thaliana x Arabidopsis arenosa]
MDSCNSGSLQSSSDDHESSSTGAPPDHSSFFLPPFQQPPSSSTFYGDPTTLSSSSSSSATYLNFVNNLISDDILNQTHLLPPPPPPPPPPPSSSRNPRKRTRASRRAPTTVLTTDTSNFRAMVQEFTGVPASPFSHPFSSTTRRFDIFRSPSDPLTYNPFRPIPQKPHHQTLNPSPSSLLNHLHQPTTSMTFPDLPLPQNHQVSTFQSLLSHQHHHQTTLSSLHDLDTINLGALQQHHHPTPDDNHHLMMRQFSEFDRRPEKTPEIHNNISSSSSAPIKDSSG